MNRVNNNVGSRAQFSDFTPVSRGFANLKNPELKRARREKNSINPLHPAVEGDYLLPDGIGSEEWNSPRVASDIGA